MGFYIDGQYNNDQYGALWDYLNSQFHSPGELEKWPDDKIGEFAFEAMKLIDTCTPSFSEPASRFTFVANSTLSGAPFPCHCTDCRAEQLDSLARMAVLYADHVYIENPFARYLFELGPSEFSRFILASDLLLLRELLPLFNAGIIAFRPDMLSLCSGHKSALDKYLAEVEDRLYSAGDLLEKKYLKDTVGLVGRNAMGYFFEVEGPEFLIEQRSGAFYLPNFEQTAAMTDAEDPYREIRPLFEGLGAGPVRRRLDASEYRKTNLFAHLISPTLDDLTTQATYSHLFGMNGLTNRTLDLEISRAVNSADENSLVDRLSDGLAHTIPTISFVPVKDLLQLRRSHEEDFVAYRNSVSRLLKDATGMSSDDLREAFNDEVGEDLLQIRRSISTFKKSINRSIRDDVAIAMAAAGFSLLGGGLPALATSAVAALRGSDLVRKLLQAQRIPENLEEHRYIFLWKLQQVGSKHEA